MLAAATALSAAACGGGGKTSRPIQHHLVYVRGTGVNVATVWIADVDGRHPRRLGTGVAGVLSPDGTTVAIAKRGGGIYLVPSEGGRERRLTARQLQPRAWAGDGKTLFATAQTANAVVELDALDRTSGRVRTIARGSLYGFDVSPDGEQLVYSRAPEATTEGICGDQFDLYVTDVEGGEAKRLTHDGLSAFPVWGESGIAFAHFPPGGTLQDCSSPGISTIDADGANERAVLERAPDAIVFSGFYGLQPLAWLDARRVLVGLRSDNGTEGAVLDTRGRNLRRLNDYADEASSDGRFAVGSGGEQSLAVSILRISDGKRVFHRNSACCPDWNR